MFKFLFGKFYYSPLWIPRSFQKKKLSTPCPLFFKLCYPTLEIAGRGHWMMPIPKQHWHRQLLEVFYVTMFLYCYSFLPESCYSNLL